MFLFHFTSWLKQRFHQEHRKTDSLEDFAQTFILEPIYTPSGLVDVGEDDAIAISDIPDSDEMDFLDSDESETDSSFMDNDSDESTGESEDSSGDETSDADYSTDPVDVNNEDIPDEDMGEEIPFAEEEGEDSVEDSDEEVSDELDDSDEADSEDEEISDELDDSDETDSEDEEISDELDDSDEEDSEDEEISDELDDSDEEDSEDEEISDELDDSDEEDSEDEEVSDELEDSDEEDSEDEEDEHDNPLAFEFPAFNSGIFQVGDSGEVGVDFLFDGGAYQGEVAFFSLAGFDEMEFDSIDDFIAAAAGRAASGSEQGHIVISVADEGARFTGSLFGEPDWNTGPYQGVKTFNMTPGDEFGVMLVPNGRVSEVVDNPSIGGAKRPLFSLATANPQDGFHLGQIADLTGDGNTFVFEDQRFERSDRDYDDVIFQIRGAVGEAVYVDEVINPDLDWRQDDMGKTLLEYAKPYITPVNNEQWDLGELAEFGDEAMNSGDDLPSDGGGSETEVDLDDLDEVTTEEAETDSLDETEDEVANESDDESDESDESDVAQASQSDDSTADSDGSDSSSTSWPDTSSNESDSSLDNSTESTADPSPESSVPVTDEAQDSEGTDAETIDEVEVSQEDFSSLDDEIEEISEESSSVSPAAEPQPLETPTRFEFAKEDQPLVGVIDTGFAENNPDLDYDNITLGRDWVDGNDNPLLAEGEGNEHGTHILGIIAAQQDNGIGIDGINPHAPIWLGRGVGSGEWANSLVEFVDAAVESGQPNAVVNLSMDLTQMDAEGNVTTRYELTPMERAAIEYARQNNVMIVAAAGNDGGVMSALGQASQEFDNIMTVGAAEQFNPDTSVWKGADRTNYSSYGQGLDVVAYGGTMENPHLSLTGDDVGTMSGTSVATAKVTGAVSQVWAANPELSYRQVVEIIRNTATDLGSTGWNTETGTGLLNMTAAVHLAKATKPREQVIPPILNVDSWSGEGVFIPGERAVDLHSASFQGMVTAPIGANLRSGPGTHYAVAGTADFGGSLTFDAWQKGEYITYPGIGADDRWYRIADKNQWIAAAITNGNPPKPNPTPIPIETPMSPPRTTTAGVPGQSRQYVVKAGDTLWGIAQRLLGNGTRWREIMKTPTGGTFTEAEAHRLQIGQSVYLPITQEIGTGKPVTPQPQPTPVRNISLKPGSSNLNFSRGQKWVTSTGYKFVFQHDGNLVLYSPQGQALWATGTNNTGANVFAVQTDGNVVLYEGSKVLWATNTSGNPGARFSIQNDGNLVVYSSSGKPIFNAATHGGRQRTIVAAAQWLRDRNLKRFPGLKFSTVVSQATGKALDAGGAKNSVYPHPNPNSQNTFHQWGFEKVGNYYIIINRATGKALDAGGSGNKLPYVHSNPSKHNPYHLWKLTKVGNGYMIVNKATGRALDSGGDSGNQIYMHPNPMSWNNFHLWKLNLPGSGGGGSSAWQHPLPGYPVSSEYGPRGSGFHYGIDVAAPTGTPIKAAKPGKVTEVGYHPNGWGNFVRINHPDGFQTIYAHLSRVNVSSGQTVSGGSTIGLVGSTGWSTGPHLHFEVRVAPYRWKTDNRNPRNYIRF